MSMTREQWELECEIRYVNPRSGNRPPSICDADGNYYTITDAAIEAETFTEGGTHNIVYYENDKGYKVVSEVDNRIIPKDSRGKPKPVQGSRAVQRSYPQKPSHSAPRPAPRITHKEQRQILENAIPPAVSTPPTSSPTGLERSIKLLAVTQIMGMYAHIEDYNDRNAAVQEAWQEANNLVDNEGEEKRFAPIDNGTVKGNVPF